MRVALARGCQRTTHGALKSNGDGNQSDRAPVAHLIWGTLHNKAPPKEFPSSFLLFIKTASDFLSFMLCKILDIFYDLKAWMNDKMLL